MATDFNEKQNSKKDLQELNRRDFLLKASIVAAGASLIPFVSSNAEDKDDVSSPQSMNKVTNTMSLRSRNLGSLKVSEIGLGCLPMIGFYGGPKSKKDMIKVIRTAFETGITFFDTAEAYGPFLDEEILGEAIFPFRKQVVATSKFGFNLDPKIRQGTRVKNSRPEHIKTAVEYSLKRLKSDYIDLYYQHRVDPAVPIEDVAGAIKDLVAAGKVKHWGLSEPGLETIRRAHAEFPLTAIQNEYSLWVREPESTVIPICEELGIGFVAWCPVGSGFLAGSVTEDTILAPGDFRLTLPRINNPENFKQNLKLLEYVKLWAKRKNASPAQISLAWILAQKQNVVPIPGTTQLSHLKENIASVDVKLTKNELIDFNKGLALINIAGLRNSKLIMDDIGVEAPRK